MSGNCTLFPHDPGKCNSLIAIKKAFGSISFIGCLFVIAVIWIFQKYKFFVHRIILSLGIAALFDSIAFLMSEIQPDNALCTFEGWYLMFFEWTVLLWVCCVTVNLFITVVYQRRTDSQAYEISYHAVCWGVSLFVSLLPFIDSAYGPAGAWCWINENQPGWRFGAWFIPQMILVFIMLFFYVYITYVLRKKAKRWEGTYDPEVERSKQLLKQEIKPLLFYPFVYLILTIFPLINRIQNAIAPDNPVYALYVLQAVFSPLRGACNAIIYGLDRQTLTKLNWTEIKLALRNRTASEPTIGEYPVQMDIDITNYPINEGELTT